ncbi:hypothetical protein FRC09_014722, partial [Ceratobasidium sp. 395]
MLIRKVATVATVLSLADSALARSYVIAGGGSAGLLLAVQLSADPKVTVTVLEAGYSGFGKYVLSSGYPSEGGHIYILSEVPRFTTQGNDYPSKGPMQRGKVLGGSSAMNALIMHRSGKYEYDLWESLGNKGWNWNSFFEAWKDVSTLALSGMVWVNNVYKKLETFHPPITNYTSLITYRKDHHGFSGPISSTLQTNVSSLFTDYIIPTMNSLGHRIADVDGEGGNATGAGFRPLAVLPLNFTRSYSGSAYFHVEGRPNLRVYTRAQATRITWGPKKNGLAVASGFEYVNLDTGDKHTVKGTDIIVSGGAISTPPLLEYSGIGDPSILT